MRERLRLNEATIHLLLACGVGVLGGLVNLGFSGAYHGLAHLIQAGPAGIGDGMARMPWWRWALTPAVGGVIAGAILVWGRRWGGGRRDSNLLEVVVAGDGRLPFRQNLFKALSSLVSISSGASIGREGLITQLTATLASKWGQWARWQPYRLRLLVACGAAAGLAAAYNAPLGGAVFAAQIVLGNFAMNLFAPLALSALVAAMVSRSFFGIDPWYQVEGFAFSRLGQLPWFLVLGACAGLVGALFLKLLDLSRGWFARMPPHDWARLGAAGLGVGALAIVYPEVWGNGYEVTHRIVHGAIPLGILGGLFGAKLIATIVTVGAGTVGGVFTPTLFLGATLGSTMGMLLHQWGCAPDLPVQAFVLTGMGSVLAATMHSPLLAIILVFELSLNYSLMPPLMLACIVSALVARRLHRDSIYTEPLRRRGLEVHGESLQPGDAMQRTVGDLMREPVPPVALTAGFRELADRFLSCSNNFLPVVDLDGRLLGLVALQDMKEHLNAGQELRGVIAYDLMRPPPPALTPNQRLLAALPALLASEQRQLPVVDSLARQRLVGSLVRAEALGLLSEAIAVRSAPES